ncbi:hypothetical protein EST38_g11064 [Candolleomyces aberdarensis]|uniref:Phosphatidic acid phosphatase type 2/haloperoxidase domain-containing protein n=1 Tax=Candolleomyces aberdarensis TaxID=2316362 RepID=A0A4Q2D7D9_9AGAR|nr:hypothetical protein EST38_g11064 [Candolleomyces aberdarensis]
MGVLKSVLTASLFQVIIKTLIGGLRPHFYSACQPNLELAAQALSQSASSNILPMFDKSICTGDGRKVNDALQTMPSGHATAAWSGLFFLSLYFNAQLKVMAAHNPAYWKMLALFAPLLGASLLSGYLVTDGPATSTSTRFPVLLGRRMAVRIVA